jgi:hypothetical protein
MMNVLVIITNYKMRNGGNDLRRRMLWNPKQYYYVRLFTFLRSTNSQCFTFSPVFRLAKSELTEKGGDYIYCLRLNVSASLFSLSGTSK